jgi:hypothetical protein
MAGSTPGFNVTQVRDALRFAMRMGQPIDTDQAVTFKWLTQKQYSSQDRARRPYNWQATPTSTVTRPDVQVLCAVEFIPRSSQERTTAFGEFNPSAVTITLLDVDYAQVSDSTHVEIDGNTYEIDFKGPPIGLFDLTVYTVYARAYDES